MDCGAVARLSRPGNNYHAAMSAISLPFRRPFLLAALALAALPGCAPGRIGPAHSAWHAQLERWAGVQALLLGEQHDVPAHQQWEADTVAWLAARGRLAALVIEMAEAGAGTDGLPPGASEDQVRAALRWNEDAWPWQRYAAPVMAAVAASVPVRGGNLDAAALRAAMRDEPLDTHLGADALARQRRAIEDGHCGLLPPARVQPMVRVQLARDASLARTLRQSLRPGRTAVLLAGYGHVQRSLGVPTWLGPDITAKVAIAGENQARSAIEMEADWHQETPAAPLVDHCAALRARWPGAAR